MYAPVNAPGPLRDASAEREIAAMLAGRPRAPRDPATFAYMAVRHAVAPLLVHAGAARLLPDAEASRLMTQARRQIALTAMRDRELPRVLDAMAAAGVPVLVIKGAHLAATCYAESWLRVRDDTDLFVRESDRARTAAVLGRLGYQPQPVQTGVAVLGQTLFDRAGAVGAALDVHWRMARPPAASAVFDFDALHGRSVALARIGGAARGPSPADALAIACVHQAAHHGDLDLLLWACDVHFLIDAFTPEDAEHFIAFARARRIGAICTAAIGPAVSLFATPGGASLLERLGALSGAEPSAALLQPAGRIGGIMRDVRATAGWRGRARLAAGHLFPPVAYMRATYAPASTAPMAWLYLRRLWRAGR